MNIYLKKLMIIDSFFLLRLNDLLLEQLTELPFSFGLNHVTFFLRQSLTLSLGWSTAVVWSRLTATSDALVQAILPQPPE